MNNRRYVRRYLKTGCQEALRRVGRSLFKAASFTALSLSLLSVGEAVSLGQGLAGSTAQAQTITTDGTTGTTVNPIVAPGGGDGFAITDGTLKGDNLFHSFDIFSPGTAYTLFDLSNPAYSAVDNVFNRVTGTSSTFIDGLLELTGGNSPSFYLLNPNGISLSTGAQLNVPGSFFATTAEQISFADGTTFSAATPLADPLLTVSAPIGLQFGAKAEPIDWTSNGVPLGSNSANGESYLNPILFRPNVAVTLLGGEVSLKNVGIDTSSGLIQVGGVAANTFVDIDADSHALTYHPDTNFQDIRIDSSRFFTSISQNLASYEGGSGDISIRGRNIDFVTSNLDSDNVGSEDGGTTDIRATESLNFADSRITTTLFLGYTLTPSNGLPYTLYPSTGRGGDIYIAAKDLTVLPTSETGVNIYDTKIGADSYSDGNAGSITINADTVSLLGEDTRLRPNGLSSIRLVSNAFERGDGGQVTVNAREFTASGSVSVSSSSFSAEGSELMPGVQTGAGGALVFNIEELMTVENGAQVVTFSAGDGRAGNIEIKAGDVLLADQDADASLPSLVPTTALVTNSFADGDGGDLTIETGRLSVLGTSNILSSSSPFFQHVSEFGDGGNISIEADVVHLENGANLSTSTYSNGNSGNLTIRANDLTMVGEADETAAGNNLVSRVSTGVFGGSGTGGDLLLEVGALAMREAAQISAGTFGAGDSGKLTVNARERVEISGYFDNSPTPGRRLPTGLFNSAEPGSSGNGGNITLTTPSLSIYDGGAVSVRTAGSGDAGNIKVRANNISVADPIVDPFDNFVSGISATVSELGSGNGGQVNIESDRLHLYNGGQITASTDGAGNAGSVKIRSGIVDVEGTSQNGAFNSSIASRSTTNFDAGSVDIISSSLNVQDNGIISVSSAAGGNAGNLSVVTETAYLNNGRVEAEASSGNQGNLAIQATDLLLLRQGSAITTNATETATGGNITLSAPIIVGFENSDISANAIEGDGGRIKLVTNSLLGLKFRDELTDQSDITASSELGVSGTIELESPSIEADSGLVELPENLEDASNQVSASCAAQTDNQFASTGRGGLPNNPSNKLSRNRPWQDFRIADGGISDVSTSDIVTSAEPATAEVLQEAGQWQVNAGGDIELLASSAVENDHADCLEQTMAAL